jgi:arylsulfatase A-like enzyme
MEAQQLILARRLLERGVRFVPVWTGGQNPWDSHGDIATLHRNLAEACDRGIGALLRDLKQRGMLEDTLVVWASEFGRTPAAELPQATGRDHNHHGFTIWMAGAGVKGGHVHGATDEFGYKAIEKPVHVHDLHATILHLLGFDHERLTYRYAGRDFRLTDVHGRVVDEILA